MPGSLQMSNKEIKRTSGEFWGSLLLVVIFISVLTYMSNKDRPESLRRTQPVPVKPMYYSEANLVRAYPQTATTHILKKDGQVYVVFQMDTEGKPVVLTNKLIGVCDD